MTDRQTVAAISTPNAAGGIGIIRVSGEKATEICDRIFKGISGEKLVSSKGYRAHFGRVFDKDEDIDECVALVFRAPHSYTGEDVVELNCHGGLYLLKRVLRSVLNEGALAAKPGEFTQRAFLNGKIDLTQAQAVMDLISAEGKQSANAALNALDGALSRETQKVSAELSSCCAKLCAWVDYPDDEIEEISREEFFDCLQNARLSLEKLIKGFDTGKAITHGVNAVIAGKPNVGKSTLMNLLSGSKKSIVSEYAGTTRDAVEETVIVGDTVLHLTDTAGLRDSENPVEAIGVEIAREKLERATLVLAVFDSSRKIDGEDIKLLKSCADKKAVAVINKCDLTNEFDKSEIEKYISATVEISAKEGTGKEELDKAVASVLGTEDFDTSCAMLTTERQYQCVLKALDCVNEAISSLNEGFTLDAVNVSVDCAVENLEELTGKKASEKVVEEIFSRFCVGK